MAFQRAMKNSPELGTIILEPAPHFDELFDDADFVLQQIKFTNLTLSEI
jgi:hypothetical protein